MKRKRKNQQNVVYHTNVRNFKISMQQILNYIYMVVVGEEGGGVTDQYVVLCVCIPSFLFLIK